MKDFRRLISEDYKTLASGNASEAQKRAALANLEAQRVERNNNPRQVPATSRRGEVRKDGTNISMSERPSAYEDMMRQTPSAHGYTTAPGSFQQFTDTTVTALPKTMMRLGNDTQRGYREVSVAPSTSVLESMSRADRETVLNNISGIQAHAKGFGKKVIQVFERFERQHPYLNQEQIYCIAKGLNIISENYNSTAGEWVVTNPWQNPSSAEQVLYNQKGISNITVSELNKKQIGNYHYGESQDKEVGKQVPPAKAGGEPSAQPYYSRDRKSKKSLQNPKRGDDYIRNANITIAKMQENLNHLIQQYNALVEGDAAPYRIKNKKSEINNAKNAITSAKGIAKMEIEKRQKARYNDPVTQYADMVESFHNRESNNTTLAEENRRQQNYVRHLSLLEETKRVLSQSNHNPFQ